MINNIVRYFVRDKKVMLGRWSLKHNCPTEALTVFNTNRDHCGDTICGKPLRHGERKDSPDSPRMGHKNSA